MTSLLWRIDFGDPSGDLEDYGLAGPLYDGPEITCANDVMVELKKAGSGLVEALDRWGMLTGGTVTLTLVPDLPADARETLDGAGPRVSTSASRSWERMYSTTAVWSE